MNVNSGSYVVASQRPWNAKLAERLQERTGARFTLIADPAELTSERMTALRPRYIFLPHWSSRIPDEVWSAHECVVFHMTDVPYGRGGSPLQNLIVRGHEATQVSALRCVRDLDAGPVYLKRPLSLLGSAEEIFIRADQIVEDMIATIVCSEPAPQEQVGEPVIFRRRRPTDSDLHGVENLQQCYDLIRMMDAEGYPHAYLDLGNLRIEFKRASRHVGEVLADVVIRERPASG